MSVQPLAARFVNRIAPQNSKLRPLLKAVFSKVGYRSEQWGRIVYLEAWDNYLARHSVSTLSALEISPGPVSRWQTMGFRRYASVQFPEFDITKNTLDEKFDIVIAEHVFEHLCDPYGAARNVRAMLSDRGTFLLATPFLVRIHDEPEDFTRWTPRGLKGFLECCGFNADVYAWGNREAIVANFDRWTSYGLGWNRSLRNERDFPLVVWAFAKILI